MAYLTMNAEIDHGCITVAEPEKLPARGKALLTVLDLPEQRTDWDKVMNLLGVSQSKADGLTVQREACDDWDHRERNQWKNP